MKWIDRHLNIVYGLSVILGLIALIYVGVIHRNVLGYLLYIAFTISLGGIIVQKKGKDIWKYALYMLVPPLFTVMVLLAKTECKGSVS